MSWCHNCGWEYLPDTTHCADCGAELRAEPGPPPPPLSDGPLARKAERLWTVTRYQYRRVWGRRKWIGLAAVAMTTAAIWLLGVPSVPWSAWHHSAPSALRIVLLETIDVLIAATDVGSVVYTWRQIEVNSLPLIAFMVVAVSGVPALCVLDHRRRLRDDLLASSGLAGWESMVSAAAAYAGALLIVLPVVWLMSDERLSRWTGEVPLSTLLSRGLHLLAIAVVSVACARRCRSLGAALVAAYALTLILLPMPGAILLEFPGLWHSYSAWQRWLQLMALAPRFWWHLSLCVVAVIAGARARADE